MKSYPNQAIRVTYVASSLPRSGPTTQLLHLLTHLDRTSFEPSVVVLSTARGHRPMRTEVPEDVPDGCQGSWNLRSCGGC